MVRVLALSCESLKRFKFDNGDRLVINRRIFSVRDEPWHRCTERAHPSAHCRDLLFNTGPKASAENDDGLQQRLPSQFYRVAVCPNRIFADSLVTVGAVLTAFPFS
jgi:hypothetical protein